MKIYTYLRISVDTGEVLEEHSFEHGGSVALCKGGSSTTTNTQDPIYNARMASISERQQDMAEEYFAFWQDEYKPYESAQIEANMGLLPTLTAQQEAESKVITAGAQGVLEKDASGKSLLDYQLDANRGQAQVAKAAYDEAMSGVDPNREAQMARADVVNSYAGAGATMRRDMSRMGVGAGGAGYASAMADLARNQAKGIAGAMTTARTNAQNTNFNRLATAAQIGIGRST